MRLAVREPLLTAFSQHNHVYLIDFASGKGWFQEGLLPTGAIVVFVSADIAIYEIVRWSSPVAALAGTST